MFKDPTARRQPVQGVGLTTVQRPPQGASAAPPSWRAQPTTAARETLSRKKNPNPQKKKNPNPREKP